jgi:hypothetical protein
MEMKIIYNKENMYPIVEQWRKTDIKQSDYADQQGINAATFKYWCRKYHEEVVRIQNTNFIEIDQHQLFLNNNRKPQIELDLPSGLRIKIY